MQPNKFMQNSDDQPISQAESQLSDDDLHDDTVSKASADYYERSRKSRIKVQQLDVWIAAGLYLILSSVALVLLF